MPVIPLFGFGIGLSPLLQRIIVPGCSVLACEADDIQAE
jgi:hypothetical protein